MNPEIAQANPNMLRRVGVALTLTAAALGGAACGNGGNEATLTSGTATSIEATTTTTSTTPDRTLILDGSDYVIAADAHITRCGVNDSETVWSANAESYILKQEANQDLLRSKEQVLFGKIGVNAANILANSQYTFTDVEAKYTKSDSLYTRIIARGDAVKMTDQAVAKQPVRENYRCEDQDNDGVGDESLFRDNRANRNDGDNVTLLAVTLSPTEWNLAVEAAYAEGIDLDAVLLTQIETITATDSDGKEVEVGVVRVFFEDDSCGNQVFKTPPAEDTPTTTPGTTPPTTPGTAYIPPKPADTAPTPGGQGSGAHDTDPDPDHDNPATGYDPGSVEEVDPDHDGFHNAVDACDLQPETFNGFQDDDGCPDVAPVVTQPANVVTGTAPATTNPPVVASTIAPAPPVVTVNPNATTTTIGADNN